jgi:hypothetical protein
VQANDNSNNNSLSNNEDPILGNETVAHCPEPDDNVSTGPLTRHTKTQWIAKCNDDDSDVTFIVDTFPDAQSMVKTPSFDDNWDDNHSSRGMMEAVLQLEDNPPSVTETSGRSLTTQNNHQSNFPLLSQHNSPLGSAHVMPVSECVACLIHTQH